MNAARFEHLLSTFGYHLGVLMTEAAPCRGRMGLGYEGGPETVIAEYVIVPGNQHPDSVDFKAEKAAVNVWDQVWFKRADGTWEGHGNRCGGRDAYAKLMASVIAQAARDITPAA